MTFATFWLVVLAAIFHASWNLLAKRAAAAGATFVCAYSLVACIAYAPWVLYLFAQGALAWSWTVIGFIAASTLLHLGYSLCLQTGYAKADLSVVYPVARGTGPMLATLGALAVLGETASGASLAGLVLVVAGIGLIATQGRFAAFSRAPEGVGWGVATGGLIASYTVVDAYAVKAVGITPVVLDWFNNLLRVVLLLPLIIADPALARQRMRGHWPAAIGVGLLSPLSYILVLTALGMGAPVGIVAPLREMSMMAGALMGIVVLREPVGPLRLFGCAVLMGGVVLLASA